MQYHLLKILGAIAPCAANPQKLLQSVLAAVGHGIAVAQTSIGSSGGLLMTVAAGLGAAGLVLIPLVMLRIRSRREIQELRAELAEQTARSERAESANEAKTEFLASISHQIRTPLNAIVGFTDLARKTDIDPELRDYMDTVRMSADWLMHVVNDVLEFSRIQAGAVQLDSVPFSISECVHSALKFVERDAAAKKLTTTFKIDPQIPEKVCGDPSRLRHVIFNLLDNAVRFTTTGSIFVSASLESSFAEDVVIRFKVADTGMGISPEKREKIFEPFQKIDGEATFKSRTGVLGLAISRRLVDLMGGRIELQSQLGAGSTFEFTARFQKYHEVTAANEAPVDRAASAGLNQAQMSILVAEDNTVNRRLITKVLESAGHHVFIATNGEEAVKQVQTEAFDLILMDVEMPGIDGLEATRAIREMEPPGLHVPIYALTAHALPADRERCMAAGMDGFLTKPFAMDELLQLISRETGGSYAPVPPENISKRFEGKQPALIQHYVELHDEPVHVDEPVYLDDEAVEDNRSPYLYEEEVSTPSTAAAQQIARQEMAEEASESVFALRAILGNPRDFAIDSPQKSAVPEVAPAPVRQNLETEKKLLYPVATPLATLEEETPKRLPNSAPLPVRDEAPTGTEVQDPFEQARKALLSSRLDIRVIHNDGDPSNRNLI